MSGQLRPAKRALPAYDTDNDIGFVARARFALKEHRIGDLTADEQVQFDRCSFCDDQIRSGRFYNDKALRNFLMAKYNISWDTANRCIDNTRQLFYSSYSNKDYLRDVLTEDALRSAFKCETMGNYDAKIKFMSFAAKMNGLLDKQVEKIDNDKLKNFQITLQFNPGALGFKPVKNKEAVLEKYRQRKHVTQRMAMEAEDAELDEQ